MLSLLKKNPKLSLKDVSSILNFDYRTIKVWWIKYKNGGIDELLGWNVIPILKQNYSYYLYKVSYRYGFRVKIQK